VSLTSASWIGSPETASVTVPPCTFRSMVSRSSFWLLLKQVV